MNDETEKTADKTAELQTKLRQLEMTARDQKIELRVAKSHGTKLAIAAAIGGAVLVAFGGQWFPGYQLDSTAKATASEMTTSAVSGIMAELCAERFMKTSGLASRLSGLNGASTAWDKASYIREGGWASTADGEEADYAIVENCRDLIADRILKQSANAS